MKKIRDDLFYVGCNDTSQALFDALIPLTDGTSYNSYLLFGSEATALIDTSEKIDKEEFFKNLSEFNNLNIDYMIMLHTEPDHASLVVEVLKKWPNAKLVCTQKAYELAQMYYGEFNDANVIIVKDDEQLNLGNKNLIFKTIPFSHWPDQLTAYLEEDQILFSSDFFGSHFTIGEDVIVEPNVAHYEAAKAYYAQIMMPLANHARKNLDKLSEFNIKYIAPAHGPIFDNKKYIWNAYENWTSNVSRETVLVLYISTHGTTRKMAQYLANELTKNNVIFKMHDLEFVDFHELARDLVDCKSIVIGTPTIQGSAHPKLLSDLVIINALKPKVEDMFLFGSFGWGQNIKKTVEQLVGNIATEVTSECFVKGPLNEENTIAFDEFIKKIK